jgi:DNA adenine methylase
MSYYTGNKKIEGVYQKIINEIPKHNYYLEAFAGSGAIGLILPTGPVKIFNDLDTHALQLIKGTPGDTVIKTQYRATDLLQLFDHAGKEGFTFCDPPYLHTTRKSDKIYLFEMSVLDHVEFLAEVQKLKCNCMIIHPACELYEVALQSWRSILIKIRYNTKTSIEKLYMNYDTPRILQTSKYLGKDCWDRQRIKRKAERFINKGLNIPFPERTYIEDTLNL